VEQGPGVARTLERDAKGRPLVQEGSAEVTVNGELVLRPVTGKGAVGEVIMLWVGAFMVMLPLAPIPMLIGSPIATVIFGAVPIFLGILGWRSLRQRGIVVTPHEITVRGLLFRRRGKRARAVSVVRARVIQPRALVFDTVYVIGADGAAVIRINGQHYARADMDRLVAFLGLPWSGPSDPVTAPQLDAAYPGVVPWHQAHPYQFGMAGAGFGVVLAVLIAVVSMLAIAL
jgi:hypothetical protein